MPTYDKTALWQRALAAKIDDPYTKERERLRVMYENVRARARPLAEEIARDFPDYTVHDITHSDALWEYADLVAGPSYPLNPSEAFVLGCSFLVHDLGMGLAAYPEGLAGLKKTAVWKDTVANLLRKGGIEDIDDEAILGAPTAVQRVATESALRRLHAAQAERLALLHWESPGNAQRFYLIEDPELRDAFGPVIGRISLSHWLSAEEVRREFPSIMGAQVGFPQEWTVDPLKLACILRCADYSHIDERRAPAFLRALRRPRGTSDDHWQFQGKLYQPRLEGDRLVFTAKSSFGIEEARAWWMCFDVLTGIDAELRQVDSLLADTRRERLAARGVSQAEEPARTARLIKTEGWQPVDTRIRVSAVADLVAALGGRDLYGNTVTPPLREMIQNAADAVRARRLLDGRPSDWGEIRVTTGGPSSERWIQVEDTGLGMSEAVLTGPLLDFGSSFWGTTLMQDQFPGLAAKGFEATGRYGIGFFSVFMWGDRVEVTSQRYDRGRADTFVLSFSKGLGERPSLRKARTDEHIPDGGTRVRVWLTDPQTLDRLVSTFQDECTLTMAQVCASLAPCLDVTLTAEGIDSIETAVLANDWLSIPDDALLRRLVPDELLGPKRRRADYFAMSSSPPLQILRNARGRAVGRVAIWNWERFYTAHSRGVVSVGGLRACALGGVIGVFVGASQRAARDSAIPIIAPQLLHEWVSRERDARLREGLPAEALAQIAEVVCVLGIEPSGLPIARTDTGWVTAAEIDTIARQLDELLLVQDAAVDGVGGKTLPLQLSRGVLAVNMGMMTVVQPETGNWLDWPLRDDSGARQTRRYYERSIEGAVVRAVATAWKCSLEALEEAGSFGSDDESCEREIGTIGGKPHTEDVSILRRPSTSAS